MQLAHAISGARHSQENRGSQRNEGFHVPHRDLEGTGRLAKLGDQINRRLFHTAQWTGRQNRQVCIRVGMRGVQVATQLFYEDPNRAAYIGNRGVYEARHELSIIAVIGGGWFRGSHSRPAKAEIAIIEASRGAW